MKINVSDIYFDYADKSTREYIKTLHLYSFDGQTIPLAKMDDNIYKVMYNSLLADIKNNAYFIPVCLYKFTDQEAIKRRQQILQAKFNEQKHIDEHLLLLGEKRIHIFTKEHRHQEGVAVYLLGIYAPDFSEDKKNDIEVLTKKAFKRISWRVPQFEFYSPMTMIFEN